MTQRKRPIWCGWSETFWPRKVVLAQKEFELTNAAVARQRETDAREALRQAQQEVINAHPVLKSHAEENANWPRRHSCWPKKSA